jgi:RHS repeat-associated protein
MKQNKIWFALALLLATVSAWATPATSYYIYDEQGHVIGEYDANGNPVQEHVYLGDRPVAVVQGGSSSTVGYVSTDQLNTPRVVTNSSKSVLWAWNSDPFGNGSPTGLLTYNMRFPGQYYDQETGHSYNYERDYDPSTGRYIESDPSGLQGGTNTYEYALENPLLRFDFYGLDANTATYGEISSWAITNQHDFTPPPGLPDAKSSIGAVCNGSNCNNVDGSNATAPGDQAAWSNIVNANGGSDQSGGGNFMCVGSQDCWFVHMYYTCKNNQKVLVPRTTPLQPSGQVNVGNHTIYFYSDRLKGWDNSQDSNTACKCQK